MPSHLIVVDRPKDFRWDDPDCLVVSADDYIAGCADAGSRALRVINLCRHHSYLSTGYYVSLLAEARASGVVPSVKTILDLERKSAYAERLEELDRFVGELSELPRSVDALAFNAYFGRTADEAFADLARRAYELFECPLLRIGLERGERWRVTEVEPAALRDMPAADEAFFKDQLDQRIKRRWRSARAVDAPRVDLAVLHDPHDPIPPSKAKTLQKLAAIGAEMDVNVELIERRDYAHLRQFDALFIRETTAIRHHTFRFARKAERAGLPVIDDPTSILRCCNKVYLAEALRGAGVPTPPTHLATRRTLAGLEARLELPVVLKIPDGAFSRGVKRATTVDEMHAIADAMLKRSDIILLQGFVASAFDWRIGVLDGEPLFAAKYFMCADHWQILKHADDGSYTEGKTVAVPVTEAPREVIAVALAAAATIGRGFYGVDLKQTADGGVVVMEVNDNPNLDVGMEDAALGDELYRRLIGYFVARVAERRAGGRIAAPGGTVMRLPKRRAPVPALRAVDEPVAMAM